MWTTEDWDCDDELVGQLVRIYEDTSDDKGRLAEVLGVSPSTCNMRVRMLDDGKIMIGSTRWDYVELEDSFDI